MVLGGVLIHAWVAGKFEGGIKLCVQIDRRDVS
jgi:hypothetical protein